MTEPNSRMPFPDPYARIRIEVSVPGVVPDGTYVVSWPVQTRADLGDELIGATARIYGSIVGDELVRPIYRQRETS